MVALAGLLGHVKVGPLSRVWRNLKRFVAGMKGSSVSSGLCLLTTKTDNITHDFHSSIFAASFSSSCA